MLRQWAVPVLLVLGIGVTDAAAQDFRVLAGASPAGFDDGTGVNARFNVPVGIAVNSAGTVFVTESQNGTIRAVTPAGVVTTFAGEAGSFGNLDGTGTAARFSGPQGAAVDSAGNVYIADTFNSTIRKITPAGVVTTLAGLAGNNGNTDGTGSAARFSSPRGVAVDGAGNVYVGDSNNHTIRMITPGGVVTTVAGLAGNSGNTDGTGNVARFNQPRGIAVDGAGVLYVADTNNHTIRRITAGGVVTTLAGLAGSSGSTNATGSAARFSNPRGVAVDSAGTTVYVADTNNNRIRQVTTPGGVVTTLAGSGASGGYDGTGAGARFNSPEGIALDGGGLVYVADTVSDTIRTITGAGVVTTLAGFYGSLGAVDGAGQAARLANPNGAAIDAGGNLYFADRTSHTIRKMTPGGNVTTLAGLADTSGTTDGTGSAARFSGPNAIAVDSAGTVYVADTNNHTIRTITPGGVVATLAGLAGALGTTDGTGSNARFSFPRGIAVDSTGIVYVADSNAHTIRKIEPGGIVTTLAGLPSTNGSADGTGSAARFNQPRGLAVDAAGTLYVADANNNTIRQVTPAGVVTTVAGSAGLFGFTDGTGSAARFGGPSAIAVDGAGTLYVADTSQNTIRKITAGGVVTTIAGCPGCIGSDYWGRFNQPAGIAVNARGDIYVADTRNNTIQTTAQPPSSLVVDFGPGYGLWTRSGTDEWSQVNPNTAEGFVTIHEGSQDALVIDFGPGVGLWFWGRDNGSDFWFQLNTASPTEMVGIDVDGSGDTDYGVFSFPGQGVWVFGGDDDEWFQLHPYDAPHMAAADLDSDGGDDVILNFPGYGVWVFYTNTSTWAQLHPLDVSVLEAADVDGDGTNDLVMDFPGYGLWSYRVSAGWSQVNPRDATRVAAGDLDGNGASDLVIDFGAGVGVWVLQNGTTWWQLNTLTSEDIATGDVDGNGHDEVFIDFGAAGVWSYEDMAGWNQVHSFNAKAIGTGRF